MTKNSPELMGAIEIAIQLFALFGAVAFATLLLAVLAEAFRWTTTKRRLPRRKYRG